MEEIHIIDSNDFEEHQSTPNNSTATKPPIASSSRKRSMVWGHFKEKDMQGKGLRAFCNYCNADLSGEGSKNGTSSLRRHLNSCKKSPIYLKKIAEKSTLKQTTISFSSKGSNDAAPFDKDECRKALARMIIKDELPFSTVEKEGFRDYSKTIQPRFNLPSRRTVVRDVWCIYEDEKKNLRSLLADQTVSLTTDTWTSIQNINYMVVTAHFIDTNWNLHKSTLNFCQITNHSGDAIGRLLEQCLREWGIEKVFSITLDNASSNDGVVRYLKRKLKTWNTLVLDGELLHMRCCAHIINLIVSDGLSEFHASIKRIRRACKYTRSSPARLAKFRHCLEAEKISSKGLLPLECKTRWNSTYFLLKAALNVKKAFDRLVEEDSDFSDYCGRKELTDECGKKKRKRVQGWESSFDRGEAVSEVGVPIDADWSYAEAFVQFLQIFYDATLKFSCYKTVTANAPFGELVNLAEHLDVTMKSEDVFMRSVAHSMKLKFDKYWGNSKDMNRLPFLAIILDPRYKFEYIDLGMEYLTHDKEDVEEVSHSVRRLLMRLYDVYKSKAPYGDEGSSTLNNEGDGETVRDRSRILTLLINKKKEKDITTISNEVERYLSNADEDPLNETFNLLQWWKNNSHTYPILSRIAKDIFGVPVSSVASEAAFSAGKRVVDPFRACLTTRTVEALICTNDWIKKEAFDYYNIPSEEDIEFFENMENVENEFSILRRRENVTDVG